MKQILTFCFLLLTTFILRGQFTGTPITVDDGSHTGYTGENSSMAIINGNPAVAYFDRPTATIKYVRANDVSGTAWGNPITVNLGTIPVTLLTYTPITLKEVNGRPAISFYDDYSYSLKYTRADNADGTSWNTLPKTVVAAPTFVLGYTFKVGVYHSMEVVNGRPAFSYTTKISGQGGTVLNTQSSLNYIRSADVNGDTWAATDTVLVDGSMNFADRRNQLKVINGKPAICYEFTSNATAFDTYTFNVKYASANDANGTTWATPLSVDNFSVTEFNRTVDGTSYVSMTEVSGNPAISYFDQINLDLKFIRATNATGTAWAAPQTLDAPGVVGTSTSMVTLTNGYVVIAYHDTDNATLKSIKSLDATGSSWSPPVTIDASYHTGIQNSLLIVNNIPAVSYFNYDDHDLTFIKANDAGAVSWGTNMVIDKGSHGSVGQSSSLKVVQGNPAIAYYDQEDGALMYVRSSDVNGVAWNTPISIYSKSYAGDEPLMQIVNGNPAIVFNIFGAKLMYVRANDALGTTWAAPVDLNINISGQIESSFEIISGKPAISFRNSDNIMLGYIRANDVDGTSWGTPIDVAYNGGSDYRTRTSLSMVNGNPAIAYTERACGCIKYVRANDADGTSWGTPLAIGSGITDPILKVVNGKPAIIYENNEYLVYVRANDIDGSSWGFPVILTANNTGGNKSFDIINNKPAVSFKTINNSNTNNSNLGYIEAKDINGAAWRRVETVDGVGNNGGNSSLTVVNGLTAMSYYDRTNGALKYVRGSIPPISTASSNALVFNGTSTYVSSAEGESGNGTVGGLNLNLGSFTIETWVKFNDAASGTTDWIAEIGSANYGVSTWFWFNNANQDGLGFNKMVLGFAGANNGTGGANFTYDFTPTVGTWYHLAYTYNAVSKKINFYVNGASQGEKTNTGTNTPNFVSRPQLRLGNHIAGGVTSHHLDGALEEFRLWNIAKNQLQIQAQYQTELAGIEIGLVTYYKFDETATQLAHLNDCSINRLDATVFNGVIAASTVPTLTDVPCGADPPVPNFREFVGFADGGNYNSWNNADNWSPRGIPKNYQTDDALIRHGVVAIDEYRSQAINIRHLTLDGAGAGLTTGTAPRIDLSGSGNFVWKAGQVGVFIRTYSPGNTILDSRFAKTLYNGSWYNQGTITWSDGSLNMDNSEINNFGGTIDMNSSSIGATYGINASGGNTRRLLNNYGTIRSRGLSGGTHNLLVSYLYNNATIREEVSLLNIQNLTNEGQLNTFVNSTVSLNNTTLNTGTTLTGLGIFRLNNIINNINIAATTQKLHIVGNPVSNNINGSGSIATVGQIDFESGKISIPLTINAGGTLNMINSLPNFDKVFASTITNSGTTNWTGGNIKFENSTFNNNALFNINVPSIVSISEVSGTTNQLRNCGTIKNQATTTINMPIQCLTAGVSTLSGVGTMTFQSTFSNNGIISPGNSPGTLTVNPSISSTSDAVYIMEIVGASPGGLVPPSADKLESTGNIALSGTLKIMLFNADVGDYTIFRSVGGTISGFNNLTILYSINGGAFTSTTPSHTNFQINADNIIFRINGAVIPVEFMAFKGKNTEGGNLLTWQTASEANTSDFDIERSNDGQIFEKIGKIKAEGRATNYNYLDKYPLSITTYYRLKINDLDGKNDYSNIVSIATKTKEKLNIFPNPVSAILTINVVGDGFQIYNLLGQEVIRGQATKRVDVSALPQGAYLLKVGAEQVRFVKE